MTPTIREDEDDLVEDRPSPPPSKIRLSLEELKERISLLQQEAHARAEAEAREAFLEDWDHPDPPTLDPVLKHRARVVWVRMRAQALWHAPWHHEEIWVWAGTTNEGQAWLEREVAYWETAVEVMEMKVRLNKLRICEEGYSLSDGTTMRTIEKVLARERAEGVKPRLHKRTNSK